MQWIDTLWHKTLKRPYRLACADVGQVAEAPLVLLHGLAADGTAWQPLVRQLHSKCWRIIIPDLLGFGASPKPAWNVYSVEEHARMVAVALRRLRLKEPAIIVGHSMGCLVAIHLAAQYPKLVRQLILYEPPLFAEDPQYPSHARRRSRYFKFFAYVAARPQLAMEQAPLLFKIARKITGLRLTEAGWIPFERSLRNTIMQQDAYNELRKLMLPVAIVHGRLDVVVIRTDLRKMLARKPNISLHMVSDMHGISARSARYMATLLPD